MIQANKLVCIYASFLHAWVHVLAQMGQIRENEVSKEQGEMPVIL